MLFGLITITDVWHTEMFDTAFFGTVVRLPRAYKTRTVRVFGLKVYVSKTMN